MDYEENPVHFLMQNFNYLKQALFSHRTLQQLNHFLLSPSSTLHAFKRQILAAMAPIIGPLLVRLNALLSNSPDIVRLVFFVLVIVVALQLLAWMQRMVVWITGLVFRMLFWAAVAATLALVWQRGPEQSIKDGFMLVGKLTGYGAALADVWKGAYREYEAQRNGPRAPHAYVGRRP